MSPVHGELLNWAKNQVFFSGLIPCQDARFRHPFIHLIVTLVRLGLPALLGGRAQVFPPSRTCEPALTAGFERNGNT
jgi:hypothetical protein